MQSKKPNYPVFLQLLGIPLPALVLAVISAAFNFHTFEIWEGILPMYLPFVGVMAIFSGALIVYSADFLFDLKKWKKIGVEIPVWWKWVAMLWLVFGVLLMALWGPWLLKDLPWQTYKSMDGALNIPLWKKFYSLPVFMLVFGIIWYVYLILKPSTNGLWLKPILVALVSMIAVYFPHWICNDLLLFHLKANGYLIFLIFLMNVWIMQAADISKDALLGDENIWTKFPKAQAYVVLFVWILAIVTAFKWTGTFGFPTGISPTGVSILLFLYGFLLLNASKLHQYPYVRFIPDLTLVLLLLRV